MTAAPKLTVGMPIYNRGHVLRETLSYVLAQTFSDFELLVFDDGSSDDSVAIVQSIPDPRVRLIGSERRGPPHPLNALYEQARGEYVIILHDHDIFDLGLLEASVAALDAHPGAAMVLQGSADVGLDGRSNYQVHPKDWPALNNGRERVSAVLLADKAFASPFHACSMVRRSALRENTPWYDPELGLHADVDLWFRLLRDHDFVYLPEVLFQFRARERRGHILDGKELETIDTMRSIFVRHGRAYFSADPAFLASFEAHVAKMHARQEQRLVLRALIRRPGTLPRGLQRLARNPEQPRSLRTLVGWVTGDTAPGREGSLP